MSKIGEYRLKIYELLFRKPICDYAETVGKRKEMNVLILGNGWAGNEAFKASFWAGQYPNSDLTITVASQNAIDYQRQVLSVDSDAILPALQLFAEQYHYAKLQFKNVLVAENDSEFAALDIAHQKYNYIIISLGDAEHNWLAASELLNQLGEIKTEEKDMYTGRIIINVFSEFSDSLGAEERELLISEGLKYGIEVSFFGEQTASFTELERIARNINFAYEMKYNQRASRVNADANFDKSKETEFVQSPHDFEIDDLSIVGNFIGSAYAADSSFASAVHIPYKLAICHEYNPDKPAEEVLNEAILSRNRLYKQLVAFEHRRWNAYMVMRGYRAPTEAEETTLLYHDGNTHQDKKRLLHIALCECGERGPVLQDDFNRQYRLWLEKKCPVKSPSELDRASLRCHQLTEKLAKQIKAESVFSLVKGDDVAYVNYRNSILKLLNDEENSLVLYTRSFESALTFALSVSSEEAANIQAADRMLAVVKIRNQRMDFLSLDAQLIEMIPFSLWYGVKYKTVLTVSNGIAPQDVIIPTLFAAATAIFIGKAVDDEDYQNIVTSYFQHRGATTAPKFIAISQITTPGIMDCIVSQLQGLDLSEVLINYVPHQKADVAIALGRLIEKYNSKINIAQYKANRSVIPLSGEKHLGIGLDTKSLSVSEFIRLIGGSVTNEYGTLYDSDQYASLCELVQNYSNICKYFNSQGNAVYFIPWNTLSDFFSTCAKDDDTWEKRLCNAPPSREVLHFSGRFARSVFDRCGIGKTLRSLQDYRIIRNYSESQVGSIIVAHFEYCDPELPGLINDYEVDSSTSKEDLFRLEHSLLKFIPTTGIKVSNYYVCGARLYKETDPQSVISAKISLLNALNRKGFIEGLSISDDGLVSFAFRDPQTMSLLKKQGSAFELAVYHLLRESGFFDDVETGVQIAWDQTDSNANQVLLDALRRDPNSDFGYKHYSTTRKSLLRRDNSINLPVENELDIIAIKGMSPVFISCKTGKDLKTEWLYEISSVSSHFLSDGVMAITADFTGQDNSYFVKRAKQIDIPIIGTETLWDPSKLSAALKQVLGE